MSFRVPFARPLCKHPVLIVNRRAIDLLKRVGTYYYLGRSFSAGERSLLDYRYKRFSKLGYQLAHRFKDSDGQFRYRYDFAALSTCYVQSDDSFEYLFLVVPCRHCSICVEHRRNDYVSRCAFESNTSSTPPIMVTLTYEEKYLPHKIHFHHYCLNHPSDDYDRSFHYCESFQFYRAPSYEGFGAGDVCLPDVQRFLKRLRINLQRAGIPYTKLRYICTGEYGSKFGRCHYHFLFWNVPFNIRSQYDHNAIDLFKSFILSSWGMCQPQSCQVEVARSAARYCTKYMTKLDQAGKMGFFVSSRGSRNCDYKGIGSKFLKDNALFFVQHPSMQCIPFLDKWNGERCEYTFGQYALDKVLPSGSRMLNNGKFKERYRELCYQASYVVQLLNRITYFRTSKSSYYERLVSMVKDVLWSVNLAPRYVSNSFDTYLHFVSPPECDFSVFKSDLPESLISKRESVALSYYYDFIFNASQFYDDYCDCVDEGYLLYLDGVRNEHMSFIPRKEVTDDLILSLSSAIEQKNAVAADKEKF